MGMSVETRSVRELCEVRQGPSGPMIVGYGVVFNSDSSDMGFIEQIDPGAATKTLQEADVRGMGNHDANWLLGRTKAGTLRLRQDSRGVWYEIDVNTNDPDGVRALEKVKRGDWDGSSFSFTVVSDQWNWDSIPPQRRILEFKMIDIGPVTFNAYPNATATARALDRVAEATGRPVDELVSALRSGEIRSLMAKGARAMSDEERAAMSAADTNDLPDSAFLYIESGGKKDSDGKTVPRSLRHLPYKQVDGSVDLPRLRNALSRLGQDATGGDADGNWLSDSLRTTLTAKAQKILAANTDAKNSVDLDPELRSLLDELDARLPGEAEEMRVGKVLSQKSRDALQAVMDQINDLLNTALGETPADSEIAPPLGDKGADENGRSLSVYAAEAEMRQRLLVLDEVAA